MSDRGKWSFFNFYTRYWRFVNRLSPRFDHAKVKSSPLRYAVPLYRRFMGKMRERFDLAPDQSHKPDPSAEAIKLGMSLRHPADHRFLLPGDVKELRQMRVACVLDDFTYGTFSQACQTKQLHAASWREEMESFRPHLLFVEAAWHGIENSWRRKVSIISEELEGLLRWCRENNVPTVFWNKDDPPHYATFINTAALFDFVFTTDIDLIGDYKKGLRNEHVYILPFWAEPRLHNPIERYERLPGFCFAGTYYVKYAERRQDFHTFLNTLSPLGPFDIYDRNEYAGNPNYSYPDEYRPFIRGSLPYDQIDRAYKGYLFGLNMNSIKQTQMMCARRTYELLASNTLVLSNYSRAMKNIFGDLILATDNGEFLREKVEALLMDADHRDRLRLAGLRKVLLEHTTERRLDYVMRKVFNASPGPSLPTVQVLAYCPTLRTMKRVVETFQRQTWKGKRLLVVCKDRDLLLNAKDLGVEGVHEDEAQKLPVKDLNVDLIACLSGSDSYGDNYLQDLALATRFEDVDGVGKSAHYSRTSRELLLLNPGQEYHFQRSLPLRCGMFQAALFNGLSVGELVSRIAEGEQEGRFLGVDRFNYCRDTDVLDDHVQDLRIADQGLSIDNIYRSAESLGPGEKRWMNRNDTILIAPHYPSYDNIYRYIFVHRRVQAYKEHGFLVDVVRLGKGPERQNNEFNGIDVLTLDPMELRSLVQSPACQTILVHFLNEEIWSILSDLPENIQIVVWVHGAEIQPWHRRGFNYRSRGEKRLAVQESERRMRFWRDLFSHVPTNVHFVFVSRFFYSEVMEDVGVQLPPGSYCIIHNFVDTTAFSYHPKPEELRKKVLSVRPFYSQKYGNDLTVKAILELSKRPCFQDMSFHIVGEGKLYEETVGPLRGFANVRLDNRSLSEKEYREIFSDYGVFLCPTRWDSQGVSRDEAMACGLVAITNKVAAIPEFVDESCCILVPAEDHVAMADAMERLYNEPALYLRLSQAGMERVVQDRGFDQTILREMELARKTR